MRGVDRTKSKTPSLRSWGQIKSRQHQVLVVVVVLSTIATGCNSLKDLSDEGHDNSIVRAGLVLPHPYASGHKRQKSSAVGTAEGCGGTMPSSAPRNPWLTSASSSPSTSLGLSLCCSPSLAGLVSPPLESMSSSSDSAPMSSGLVSSSSGPAPSSSGRHLHPRGRPLYPQGPVREGGGSQGRSPWSPYETSATNVVSAPQLSVTPW